MTAPIELFTAQPVQPLYALTVHQPWGSSLLLGRPVESRQRQDGRVPYPQIKPGWLAIHAGMKAHPWAGEAYRLLPGLPPLEDLPRGALLGAIYVLGWLTAAQALAVPELAPWVFPGQPTRHYLRHDLARAVRFETPIPCSGAQGVWRVLPRLVATQNNHNRREPETRQKTC